MPNSNVPVITIDGPTASGKGTVASRVADRLSFHLLDSGALYRLTALQVLRRELPLSDEHGIAKLAEHLPARFQGDVIYLAYEDVSDAIRVEAVGNMASKIAALPSVRQALFGLQLGFRQTPGLVADGRDMGTVIFPTAKLKVFLTASAEARAQRRYKQLIDKGISANMNDLLADLQARDERDTIYFCAYQAVEQVLAWYAQK
jgi:cytidylate kinase